MSLYADIDLLSTRELLGLPPVRYLMDGLIPEEGFVGLYGAPASGKSFIALDWAMCISEGRPWLGTYRTTQTPVVYVAAEGGRGIQQRVAAWMRHYGYRDLGAMYFLLNPLYVREEGVVEEFIDHLIDIDVRPGLIVLDTLSRSFGGGEENASADMGEFVDQMTRLASATRMAALVVHHKNATGTRERGSTAFRGAADAMFSCSADRDKATNRIIRVELVNDKQKDGAEAEPIYLAPIADVTKSLVFEQCEAPAKKDKGTGVPQPMRKVDMLTYLGGAENGLTFTEWRLGTGVPKATFKRRLNKLMVDREIYKDDNGRYFVYPNNVDLIDEEDD